MTTTADLKNTDQRYPPGLYSLLYVMFWDRFSWYALLSILMFYVIQGLEFTDHRAYSLYGVVGCVYHSM